MKTFRQFMEQSASGAPLNKRQVISLDAEAQKNLQKTVRGKKEKPVKFYLTPVNIPMK
jgi:hypothetical protein